MNLLEDIQNSAVDKNCDLGTLLRKCRLLAAKLGNEEFENWVRAESDGYPKDAEVPEYRTFTVSYRGHFVGLFGYELRNAEIPPFKFDKDPEFSKHTMRESASQIESLLANEAGSVRLEYPGLASFLGQSVYEQMNCLSAWAQIGNNQILGIVNSIRNRVLEFSIELWKIFPDAGTSKDSLSQVRAEQISNVFNNTIHASNVTIMGSSTGATINNGLPAEAIPALIKELDKLGVPTEEISALTDELKNSSDPLTIRKTAEKWIASLPEKITDNALTLGSSTIGTAVTTWLSQFLK